MRRALAVALVLGLTACAGAPKKDAPPASVNAPRKASDKPKKSPYPPAREDPNKRGNYTAGGLYAPGVDDTAPDVEIDVSLIPEPQVVALPRSRYGNRETYTVLGEEYHVLDNAEGYVDTGMASYYGTKFHGRRTSNMEVYDMYAFTAAHKTLPLPSFARVTNLDNGKSVVVRVNDRGPFHEGRIIDLSYAAALKLGVVQAGTARVRVRALIPGEDSDEPIFASADNAPSAAAPTMTAAKASSLDKLVATLPLASAAAVDLPPGVRIATGKPTRLDGKTGEPVVGSYAPAGTPASASAAATTAATTAANVADAADEYRFDMRQDGKTMTADQFDAWMRSRRVRVATGKPGKPDAAASATTAASTTRPAVAMPAPEDVPAPVPTVGATTNDGVTLQVASFAARSNADRALAMLRQAGIDQARLLDANANGQQVWRLRVGPLDPDAVAPLAERLAGLGFGQPQRVHD